ncbi:MAG: hypothetical protein AAFP84_21105, partial [Actinomycetota bacterium]
MSAVFRLRQPIVAFSAAVFAIVLAVAASAGLGFASPSSPGDGSVFVPIDPARVLDSRTGLGLNGAFVSKTPRDLQITGGVDTAAGTSLTIPDAATSVVMNVTAVVPSSAGFVAVRPSDASGAPTTSNLNFAAGAIVPNNVSVELGPDGAVEIWFEAPAAGETVDVLADVVGYYLPDDHDHDDRYYTEAEIDEIVTGVQGTISTVDGKVEINADAVAA